MAPVRLLFVCLGNICRSPAAEGVFAKKAKEAGLDVILDSAGTGAWHVGHAPDRRMQKAAQGRGYDLSSLRARQVDVGDFYVYDLILAMDESNMADLKEIAPPDGTAKLAMVLSYGAGGEVPDPYYGSTDGFAHVLDLLEAASDGLIASLVKGSWEG
ncbi:MAG: low molecular weight protein-tyrosine-phosphatase [Pseudomonadota bacterium]